MLKKQLQAPALSMNIQHCLLYMLLALSYFLFALPAFAQNDHLQHFSKKANLDNHKLIQQRLLYQQANKAFNNRHFNLFKKISMQLKDYPLYPYLEYRSLMRKPLSLKRQQVQKFLEDNDDTVIGYRFRKKLISKYSQNRQWQNLINIYRPGYGVHAQCKYLNALLHTEQSAIAYPKIEQLWLSAKSRPKACDRIFKQWQTAGYRTPQLIWQRFKLAISLGNLHLARYLKKSMPKNNAKIAKIWIRAHKQPKKMISTVLSRLKHPDQGAMLLHSLKRLSYKDISAAINTYQQLNEKQLTKMQHNVLIRHFGLRLAREHMPNADLWLARVSPEYVDKQVEEWIIRTAIRQGNWKQLLNGIEKLPLKKQTEYRWQYWWAYSNDQLGNSNEALGIFQYLATKRDYYGFLSADHLNLPYAFEEKAIESSNETISSVFAQPEALRAREFYFMNKIISARREWRQLILKLSNDQMLAASKIAQHWKWHDRAIITMGKTRYRDDIELRFPLHLDNKVFEWSELRKIDPVWTYAIIRRESAFMPDARSPVGAMGLMQLMPRTARQVARYLKIRYHGRSSLLGSNTNIRLGTGYLERMLNKLDSQQVLATAAYNAGPNRVEKWLPKQNEMNAVRWIETIPFTETREYVSNILAYMAIYEHRMERQVTRLSLRMPPVQAREPASNISKSAPPVSKPPRTVQAKLKNTHNPI